MAQKIHDGMFLKILWDGASRTIFIDWKEATAGMTDDDFKAALTLFAHCVEKQKAHAILVDVSQFRYKMGPGLQEWRVKNISPRYYAAGVRRFAFLFPVGVAVPPMMNQSAPGESFLTRGFNGLGDAMTWLKEADSHGTR